MKKLSIISVLTLAMVLMLGLGAKAQSGNILAGGGLVYATDISKPGVFVHGVYKITPEWEGAADFTYFLPKKQDYGYGSWTWNWSALNLNAHYVFYAENEIEAYGLGGLSLLFGTWKTKIDAQNHPGYAGAVVSNSETSSHVGLNLGAGGRYQLSDNLYGLAELKFAIMDGSYFQISAGLLYAF